MSEVTIPTEERKDIHEQALEEATRAVAVIFRPDDVVELRVPKAGRNRTISGYFNVAAALVEAIREMDGKGPGVYVTLNPVKPELLARANNRVKAFAETTTSDADIVLRRWLLVDCDPVRPAGISSSRQELEAALDTAEKVREYLRGRHWPEPVFCLSGNGFHLLYRLPDLANTDASTSLISRSLKALSARFSSATVHIDETVFNAARISKAYGTFARKGDHTPERPYRLSRMLDIPDPVAPVSVELLEQLAAEFPEARRTTATAAAMKVFAFDVEAWMVKVGIVVEKGPASYRGGRRWTLAACPFDSGHTGGSAAIFESSDGVLGFKCQHNGCGGKGWKDVRRHLDPEYVAQEQWQAERKQEDRDRRKERREARARAVEEVLSQAVESAINFTDLGNARLLVSHHGSDFRYCHESGKVFLWSGTRWEVDATGRIELLAKRTVGEMYRAAAKLKADEREVLVKHALASESRNSINAMVMLARSEPGVPVRQSELDASPWLLNCLNGVVDLTTGELRPHRREDLLTRLCPVHYDAAARSELWEKMLQDATGGDRDLLNFLQTAAGYSITGATDEEVLFFVHGPAASGKSTFLESLKATLGDYSKTADFESFVQRREAGAVRNDIAELAGRRFVVSIEVDQGKKLAEGLVKLLTGGDTVRARFLYHESFEFTPVFKLWLAANHAPRVKDDDTAMWRRILRIPFDQTIPPQKRRPLVKATLRNPAISGPAILAWAVEGALRWREERLHVPDVIRQATEDYRTEMDPLKDFMGDCCVLHADAWISAARLWREYEEWAKQNGERYMLGRNAFADRLRSKGCQPFLKRINGDPTRGWTGIGLRAGE
jgi:putative DNA primase/helicase